jgi:hypothetical protein
MSKFITMIGHDDAPHLNPPVITVEEREELFEGMQEHERQARETGRPALGAGAIYPIREDIFFIDPIQIPDWWEYAWSMDPGWNVTAGLLIARNPDTDQHYLVAEYYGIRDQPVVHSLGLKAMLPWPDMIGLIDPAGANVGNLKDGTKMKEEYEDLGFILDKANNAVHSGLRHCLVKMQSGLLKCFNTLPYFKKEFRLYRRDIKGKIVKANDHLLDDMRYIMNTPGAFKSRPIERANHRQASGEW